MWQPETTRLRRRLRRYRKQAGEMALAIQQLREQIDGLRKTCLILAGIAAVAVMGMVVLWR